MKLRKCKQCAQRKPVEGGVLTPLQWFCSVDHAVLYSQEARRKQTAKAIAQHKKREKEQRATHKALKDRLKTKSQWMREAQTAFNRYIRERDFFDPCISCGRLKADIERWQGWKTGGSWDAGHFKSRGAKPQLKFNTYNCHKQCKSCNGGPAKYTRKESTVTQQYEMNLIEKIGASRVELLKNNNNKSEFSIAYLQKVKRAFSKRARHIVKIRNLRHPV